MREIAVHRVYQGEWSRSIRKTHGERGAAEFQEDLTGIIV